MAKRRKMFDPEIRRDKSITGVARVYLIMGIVICAVTIANMLIQNAVYIRIRDTLEGNLESVQTINGIQQNFDDINEQVLLLIATVDTPDMTRVSQEVVETVTNDFAEIDDLIAQYKQEQTGADVILTRRFSHAEYAIAAYRRKINEVKEEIAGLTHESGLSIYNQELAPLQITAAEMLQATIEIDTRLGQEKEENAKYMRGAAQGALALLLIATMIFLFVVCRKQINSLMEVKQKEKELTEAGNRLSKSRKKLMDSAMTNILTGMKNRYALDESLSQLIGNAQFNIAVFDIDNFRMFNDMYGYELGDEYLATVAERLKEEYSEYAEMFNITGNEFCMVFYEHVSDLQSQQLAEQIRQGIGQPTLVAGIPLQATVSASLYHYLPSDNLDVNTLLMKMDSALHAAKRDGGNRMYQIQ